MSFLIEVLEEFKNIYINSSVRINHITPFKYSCKEKYVIFYIDDNGNNDAIFNICKISLNFAYIIKMVTKEIITELLYTYINIM